MPASRGLRAIESRSWCDVSPEAVRIQAATRSHPDPDSRTFRPRLAGLIVRVIVAFPVIGVLRV